MLLVILVQKVNAEAQGGAGGRGAEGSVWKVRAKGLVDEGPDFRRIEG
jgi:hypothetical protein